MEDERWSNLSEIDRSKVLFGETLCVDPVSNGKYIIFDEGNRLAPAFRLSPSKFLRHARANRPLSPEPTASSFAQWIYSLYSDEYGIQQDQELGKAAEDYILAARQEAYTSADHQLKDRKFSDWRLLHRGMGNTRGTTTNFLLMPDLVVAGEPLRALPDLIYENRNTGEVLIVKIKHSRMTIPSNLWPNIWGQLWCYSQLEQARRAPKVTVVGEVWGDAWTPGRDQMRLVCLRANVRRNPRLPSFDRFFSTLFDIYRGVA